MQNTTYCIGKIIHKAASIKVCKPVVNKYSGLRIPQLLTHYISSKVRLCLYIQAVKLVKHLYTLYTLWPSSREFDAFQINLPLKISMPAHPPASAGFWTFQLENQMEKVSSLQIQWMERGLFNVSASAPTPFSFLSSHGRGRPPVFFDWRQIWKSLRERFCISYLDDRRLKIVKAVICHPKKEQNITNTM